MPRCLCLDTLLRRRFAALRQECEGRVGNAATRRFDLAAAIAATPMLSLRYHADFVTFIIVAMLRVCHASVYNMLPLLAATLLLTRYAVTFSPL